MGAGRAAAVDGVLGDDEVLCGVTVADVMRAMMQPGESPILAGIGGSTAFGLATAGSDRDVVGVHVSSTMTVLGLGGVAAADTTRTSHEPTDAASHELGKLCGLGLKCNPTVLELLWLPRHAVTSEIGDALIDVRDAFLSEKAVRGAFTGYAIQQARRLRDRHTEGRSGFDPDLAKRTAKHGRHCLRILRSGGHLLATGELLVDVSHWRDEIFSAGELAESDPVRFHELFERELAAVDSVRSVLPEHPDRDRVSQLLVWARLRGLEAG